MYAIVTTDEGWVIKLIGPFPSKEAASQWAKDHKYWGVSICVKIQDPI